MSENKAASTEWVNSDGEPLAPHAGCLVVNADDWGRDRDTTDRTLDCVVAKAVSSVSAMVFMKDSERGAAIARERAVDAGLHLNFTTPFSGPGVPAPLSQHQNRISRYLLSHRFAPVLFHPGLMSSFEYVVVSQLDEYRRVYGDDPRRIDGHHHMHLCANVLLCHLMPSDTIVRRNFTFRPGEKGICNRMYRRMVDSRLRRRYQVCDYLFTMVPLQPLDRLRRIFSLAHHFAVEVETHPINPDEYRFLMDGEAGRLVGDVQVARQFVPCLSRATPSLNTRSA